ncbi:hypothetical protein [Erythrobacter ani]|uniref:Transposase n=1 Tax=Erythrobacter ani TaxID=2827235 RepID=A0ABS6SRA0_9SPHN|nr:hypothetical protein [Erythrobacter ani]MBV7267552.1 hypothetical protein [Erythrobacter ani]
MIKLTYPRPTHSLDEIRPLFDEFRRTHPDTFREWYAEWEYSYTSGTPDRPKKDPTEENPTMIKVAKTVYAFLSTRTEHEDFADLGAGFDSFQSLMHEIVRSDLKGERS